LTPSGWRALNAPAKAEIIVFLLVRIGLWVEEESSFLASLSHFERERWLPACMGFS